jgi:hypothetical protein
MIRFLTLCLLAACETPKFFDSSDTGAPLDSSNTSTDSADTAPDPRTLTATITGYSLPRRDQVYDIEALPSAGPGCVAIGNPYSDGFTGAIYVGCPGALDLPDDAVTIWTGSTPNQALGCNIEIGTIDGAEVIGSSEFADPTYVGRGLLWPTSAPSSIAADVVLVDVSGAQEGDGFTGGYFGTMILPYNGQIIASQTNAIPYLLSATYAEGLTLDDFAPLVEYGSTYVDASTGGFAGYDASAGDDGIAVASYGGIVQHLDPDGASDWWADMESDGDGEYPWRDVNNVTLWTSTDRLHTGEIVVSTFSRETRAVGEYTFARIFEPTTGAVLDDLSNVYGVASGDLDGTEWRAVGVTLCDPSFSDCRAGYIEIETASASLVVSLPFEADTFPEGGCLVSLTSDGVSEVGWFCKDRPYGGFLTISLE